MVDRLARWCLLVGVIGVAGIAGVVGGCSLDEANDAEARAGAVYEAVVRWLVGPVPEGADPHVVFVEARGQGAGIGVKVEAALIGAVDDVASVRFIDERTEALTEIDGRTVVRDDGLLLRFDPVVEEGSEVTLDVDRYVGGDVAFESIRFELQANGAEWSVVGRPETEGG